MRRICRGVKLSSACLQRPARQEAGGRGKGGGRRTVVRRHQPWVGCVMGSSLFCAVGGALLAGPSSGTAGAGGGRLARSARTPAVAPKRPFLAPCAHANGPPGGARLSGACCAAPSMPAYPTTDVNARLGSNQRSTDTGWRHHGTATQSSGARTRRKAAPPAHRMVMKFFRDLDILSPSMPRCPACKK